MRQYISPVKCQGRQALGCNYSDADSGYVHHGSVVCAIAKSDYMLWPQLLHESLLVLARADDAQRDAQSAFKFRDIAMRASRQDMDIRIM